MSHEHPHDRSSMPSSTPGRSRLEGGPRLELPRFEFRPSSSLARTPEQPRVTPQVTPQVAPQLSPQAAPPQAAPHAPAPRFQVPASPLMAPAVRTDLQPAHHWQAPAQHAPVQHAPVQHAPVQHAPQYAPAPQYSPAPQHAPAPQYAPAALSHAVAPPVPAPAPMRAPAPAVHPSSTVHSNVTRPAQVTWSHEPAERTLLQRITPVHMGVLMVMVVLAMVVTSGPAAMSAKPAKLPAVVSGGGIGPDGMPIRAGSTAVAAATPVTATPKARASARVAKAGARSTRRVVRRAGGVRMLVVGSARLRSDVRAGGIPSPAAAANLAVAGGGRLDAGSTGEVHMNGIPSPAASEKLGPQKLPFRANDGVTLPRTAGERDAHAVDTHYGDDTLPMEEPVELPAMTPGDAATRAENRVIRNELAGGAAPAPNLAGGLSVAM